MADIEYHITEIRKLLLNTKCSICNYDIISLNFSMNFNEWFHCDICKRLLCWSCKKDSVVENKCVFHTLSDDNELKSEIATCLCDLGMHNSRKYDAILQRQFEINKMINKNREEGKNDVYDSTS